MPDHLYYSCWLRNYSAMTMLRNYGRMLDLFPFSPVNPADSILRIQAVSPAEPALAERAFLDPIDPKTVTAEAGEFLHDDCAYTFDSWWGIRDHGSVCCTAADLAVERQRFQKQDTIGLWARSTLQDERRLLTAVNNGKLRTEFCRLYVQIYPGHTDHGCPADHPPPTTIVTAAGDVPLLGEWPR